MPYERTYTVSLCVQAPITFSGEGMAHNMKKISHVVVLEGDWLLIPTTLPLSQPVYLSRRVVFPVVR